MNPSNSAVPRPSGRVRVGGRLGPNASSLLSSDEAPDSAADEDDSDEDLITSYLSNNSANNSHHNANSGSNANGLMAAANAAAAAALDGANGANSNHILEDNLMQLAEIHENIQKMRLENAAEAAANSSGGAVTLGHKPGLIKESLDSRLSNSCPSLNNEEALDNVIHNSNVRAHINNNNFTTTGSEESPEAHYPYGVTPTSSLGQGAGRLSRRRGEGVAVDGNKHRSKRQHGRQRSLSMSSSGSDDGPAHRPNSGHAHHASDGGGSDFVDGFSPSSGKNRPRSSSSVATGRMAEYHQGNHGHNVGPHAHGHAHGHAHAGHGHHMHAQHGRSVFKTPEKLLPRPPVGAKKTPHIFAQFPTLHKSISTPSIVAGVDGDRSHKHSSGKKGRNFPEPTHVFLQKLISEHDWTRRSGSESETDDDLHHLGQGREFETTRHAQFLHGGVPVGVRPPTNRHLTHGGAQAPSPQLSLAEFLKDVPGNVEEDEQRKRRRKKERSSIFFRKKKEKQPKSQTAPILPLHSAVDGSGYPHHFQGPHPSKSLSKVPSAISLTSKPLGSSRMPQHSYSMSSLRKPLTSQPHGSNSYIVTRPDISKLNNDERDDYGHEETLGLIEGEYAPGEEFPEGGPAAIRNLETDPFLRIQEVEPESWQALHGPQESHRLSPTQIKRQEHIYELILTESNHCQVLKVIQKIFVEGMYKYLNMPREIVERIFPVIDDLIELHFRFLHQLRVRQNEENVVASIADILLDQFSGENARPWKEAYGLFCSQHSEAVNLFKDISKSDRRFQQFIRQSANNPLLKKKGVAECILFVTTRITKYPLLIEPLIKTAKDIPTEQAKLKDASIFVRDILRDVNSKVAEKEREQRFLSIYKGIDPKSSLAYEGKKFKKSDVLSSSRKLMFEGLAVLHQGRNRSLPVTVVVLSDIMFFLQESNQKYYFFTPEGKPGVVPVHTMVAREKQGASTKSLYLISTSEKEPEMFELEITQPPTRDDWITGIREAVDASGPVNPDEETESGSSTSLEEARRHVEAKYMRMRYLTAELRSKDIDLARLLEDKMRIMNDMQIVLGNATGGGATGELNPNYLDLVREKDSSSAPLTKEDLLNAVQEASRLASSLYSSGSNLARSVSSAGEQKSETYTSPILPKRAETFGGFDQQGAQLQIPGGAENAAVEAANENVSASGGKSESASNADLWRGLPSVPPLLQLAPEQQQAAVHMTHYLNTLMCMVSEHFTSLESMKVELAETKERSLVMGGRYKQNQQLEELRHLQDRMSHEKRAWQLEKEATEQDMEAKKRELIKTQSETERDMKDVKEQRDQLYRKLDLLKDVLKAQGIEIMGPNMNILKTNAEHNSQAAGSNSGVLYYEMSEHNNAPTSANTSVTSTSSRVNATSSSFRGPVSGGVLGSENTITTGGSLKKDQLMASVKMSATNDSQKLEKEGVKQQIPVKLSSKLSVSGGSSSGSSQKDKSSKKMSSVVNLGKQASLASSSSLSSSMGNIAKPIVEGSNVQQILPFKLSESLASSSGSTIPVTLASSSRSSPKTSGYHKLSSMPSPPNVMSSSSKGRTPPSGGARSEANHQRTGSSPAQTSLTTSPRSSGGMNDANTLPKSSASFNSGSSSSPAHNRSGHAPKNSHKESKYNVSSEDKVIYF